MIQLKMEGDDGNCSLQGNIFTHLSISTTMLSKISFASRTVGSKAHVRALTRIPQRFGVMHHSLENEGHIFSPAILTPTFIKTCALKPTPRHLISSSSTLAPVLP